MCSVFHVVIVIDQQSEKKHVFSVGDASIHDSAATEPSKYTNPVSIERSKSAFGSNESCERHCERTSGQFGCVVNGEGPAIAAFASVPGDLELRDKGCRCLMLELLCDRQPHCLTGSDEWPQTCAKWNASAQCPSSDFKCLTGLALHNHSGRRPFCIPITAYCDGTRDCIDGSDELKCLRKSSRATTATIL